MTVTAGFPGLALAARRVVTPVAVAASCAQFYPRSLPPSRGKARKSAAGKPGPFAARRTLDPRGSACSISVCWVRSGADRGRRPAGTTALGPDNTFPKIGDLAAETGNDMSARTRKPSRQRVLLAQAAARIMAEQGIRDYRVAKNKAAEGLGVSRNSPHMPRNTEIEAALDEYLRLFRADTQPLELTALRRAACEAMRFFEPFRPRLVGSVLSGNATRDSRVSLHLFADTPEQVVLHLLENDVPFDTDERRLRVKADRYRDYPVYRFHAGGVGIEAVVFPDAELRQAPLSPVDGKPMRRAALAQVEALLAEAG